MDATTTELPELITIEEFMAMLGYKSTVSYYNHRNDPGYPQRVYLGGKPPMLVKEECLDYMRRVITQKPPRAPKMRPRRQRAA